MNLAHSSLFLCTAVLPNSDLTLGAWLAGWLSGQRRGLDSSFCFAPNVAKLNLTLAQRILSLMRSTTTSAGAFAGVVLDHDCGPLSSRKSTNQAGSSGTLEDPGFRETRSLDDAGRWQVAGHGMTIVDRSRVVRCTVDGRLPSSRMDD